MMSVRVRYRPHDLGESGVVETFDDANGFHVHDDNTLELRHDHGEGRVDVVGEVHPDRWDSVVVVEDDDG